MSTDIEIYEIRDKGILILSCLEHFASEFNFLICSLLDSNDTWQNINLLSSGSVAEDNIHNSKKRNKIKSYTDQFDTVAKRVVKANTIILKVSKSTLKLIQQIYLKSRKKFAKLNKT